MRQSEPCNDQRMRDICALRTGAVLPGTQGCFTGHPKEVSRKPAKGDKIAHQSCFCSGLFFHSHSHHAAKEEGGAEKQW